jgi:small GTP-binding protein
MLDDLLQKKICMLGSYAVGKTSLIRRYVHSIYEEKYHTTIKVKVDEKVVQPGERKVKLVLWDIYGEDDFQKMHWSYVRGCFGYLLVADGTRRATLDRALELEERARAEIGPVPFILVINKVDLQAEWEIDDAMLEGVVARGWTVIRTSAKTDQGVNEAFEQLTMRMLR